MSKLTTFNRSNKTSVIAFVETQEVKEGVVCDVYEFTGNGSCDLGIISVSAGNTTPKQKILTGDKTIEGFLSGQGTLRVIHPSGENIDYHFPNDINEVELHVGDIMQWAANTDLTFYEICFPKYKDGRFQNLD